MIAESELLEVASRALQHPTESVGSVEWNSMGPVAASSATAGLWRISTGTIDSGGSTSTSQWSAVLKVVHHSKAGHKYWMSSDDVHDPMYWKREAVAYQSGLLDSLHGGLRSAALLGCFDTENGDCHLWLEDVAGDSATLWPLERFGVAARHFGRAQGEFLVGRPLPNQPWLSQGWLRSYVARREPDFETLPPSAAWNGSLARLAFPESLESDIRKIWNSRHRTLDALDRIPQTLCHLDSWPLNLFSGVGATGDESTIAIDWAYVGIGALAEDMGNLVPDSMLDLFVDSQRDGRALYETVYEGYLAGLADVGWSGDPRIVRFSLNATASLKYAWMAPRLIFMAMDDELLEAQAEGLGTPIEEVYAKRGAVMSLLCDLARESQVLASELGL